MRVLAVCQNYWPEPFNIHEMCEGLVRLGHDVTVLTGLPNYPDGVIPKEYLHGANREQFVDGVRILRVGEIPRGKNLKGLNVVKRALNYVSFAISGSLAARSLGNYDIVLAFQLSPISMVKPAACVAKKSRIPLVIYAIDLWPEDLLSGGVSKKSLLFKFVKAYSKHIYNQADVIAITSPDFEKYLKDYLRLTGKQYPFLPQYAESFFEEMACNTVQESHGEEFRIVFAGNVGANQALESAIVAMAMLPTASRAVLHVYGNGSRVDACKQLIKSLDISGKVILHGRKALTDMPSVYKEADCMLLTLANPKNESLVPVYTIPRKLQSYFAAGKPVIASANGVAGRIVDEVSCGVSCEGENPESLALAIVSLESKPASALEEMGKRAKNYYMESYSKSKFFERLETILEGARG